MKKIEKEVIRKSENKKNWDLPQVVELDFAETRADKCPGGVDGANEAPGNFKDNCGS